MDIQEIVQKSKDVSVYIEEKTDHRTAVITCLALEEILTAEVCVLVKDDLIHIEFVKVSIKERDNDRFKFHNYLPFIIRVYLSGSSS